MKKKKNEKSVDEIKNIIKSNPALSEIFKSYENFTFDDIMKNADKIIGCENEKLDKRQKRKFNRLVKKIENSIKKIQKSSEK